MSTQPGRLDGRVAVVTGASSGNGRATALALAREGAAVACADLRPDPASGGFEGTGVLPTHEQIEDLGGSASYVHADVTSPEEMDALGQHAVDRHGRIDIWVNNAGIVVPSPIDDMPIDAFNKELAVDLTGTWLGCKVAARAMRSQPRIGRAAGHIINLGSIAGSFGNANITAYAAAKGGVHAMTRALATELGGDGITVNAVLPGFLPTAMNRGFWDHPQMLAAILAATALAHPGMPEDVANAIVFLASEDAAWITGVLLPVDGGFSAIGAFTSMVDVMLGMSEDA
ncbi:SDR family NAD(P)-dependent oxidoreductase [uncultured Jatrophihabitans sp.]|uniref:SDR family NAD(P)-dependent oxidoreductase n=1 Tax=uncultured Jatrophihabitans sp. TaxID=1610747 RepID=UPI0035C9CC49